MGDSGEEKRVAGLRAACYANLGQCCLKQSDAAGAIMACDESLALEPSSVKVLFRRAQAHRAKGGSGTAEAAVRDLMQAAELDPNDNAVSDALRRAQADLRKE